MAVGLAIVWIIVALLVIPGIVSHTITVWRSQGMALQKRLHLLGVFILGTGLVAAALVYRNPPPEDESGIIGYTFEGGKAFPIRRGVSRGDQLQMAMIGGKANISTTEFVWWVHSLWHGRK